MWQLCNVYDQATEGQEQLFRWKCFTSRKAIITLITTDNYYAVKRKAQQRSTSGFTPVSQHQESRTLYLKISSPGDLKNNQNRLSNKINKK